MPLGKPDKPLLLGWWPSPIIWKYREFRPEHIYTPFTLTQDLLCYITRKIQKLSNDFWITQIWWESATFTPTQYCIIYSVCVCICILKEYHIHRNRAPNQCWGTRSNDQRICFRPSSYLSDKFGEGFLITHFELDKIEGKIEIYQFFTHFSEKLRVTHVDSYFFHSFSPLTEKNVNKLQSGKLLQLQFFGKKEKRVAG